VNGGKDAMNLILIGPFGNGGGQYGIENLDVLNEVRNGAGCTGSGRRVNLCEKNTTYLR
jgi:hypothetical protein